MKEMKYFLADVQSQLLRASEEHHVAMESMLKSLFDELGHQFELEQQRLEAEFCQRKLEGLPLGSRAPVPVSLDSLVAEKPEEPGTADPWPTMPTGGSEAETPSPPMIQSALQSMEAPSDCISPYETDYSGNSAQAIPIPSDNSGLSKRLFSSSKQNGPGSVFFKNKALQSKVKKYLNVIAGVMVMMNSLVMMVELELEGRAAGVKVGLLSDGSAFELSKIEPIFQAFDTAFVFIFLVECLVRITVEGIRFFRDLANWFDFGLVVVGLVDTWVIVPVSSGGDSDHQNIVMMRIFRILKCLRAIRMVRTIRLFRGLNLLVKACVCFLPSLFWSMLLLIVFMSIGTLVMGNLLRDFVLDSTANFDDRQWIWIRYGTAYRAMYTLYEVTFAGNWPTNARPVMEKAGHGYVVFFLLYVTLIVFAVIRVISAIFLKDTLDAAQNDAEQLVADRLRKKAQYVRKLEEAFKALNPDSDGMLTEERLVTVLANPKVVAYFQTLDVDLIDSKNLFNLLDNGDGEVTLEEFIEGILRCKGQARAIDQVAMRAELRQVDRKISRLSNRLKDAGFTSSKSLSVKQMRERVAHPGQGISEG